MVQKKGKEQVYSQKEWYIIVENRQEGPYSILELKRDLRFNPDTLVWKRGFKEWLPARAVAEIAEAFVDEEPAKPLHEPSKGKKIDTELGGESPATLAMHHDPYQLLLWILVALLVIVYAFYQFFDR